MQNTRANDSIFGSTKNKRQAGRPISCSPVVPGCGEHKELSNGKKCKTGGNRAPTRGE